MSSEPGGRALPRLLVFTDSTRAPRIEMLARFERLCARAQPGSVAVVVRDYQLSARARRELGRALGELTARTGQELGVADRADLASALGAGWLHLPEQGLRAEDARRLLGEQAWLSRACHDPEQVGCEPCDALLLSPVIAVRKGRSPLGAAGLERARSRLAGLSSPPRLFALGGVDHASARSCLLAGADGVAVIGAALEPEPEPLLAALGIVRAK